MQQTLITDINQLDPNGMYSYADYLKWQFDEYVELIRGKIIKKMSPAPLRRHQVIVGNIYTPLRLALNNNPCDVYVAPFDVRFPSKDKSGKIYTVVQPDICVICDASKLDDKGCIGAPDLIVEVLSKSSAIVDYNFKYNLYEEQGVKEYWIADPNSRTLIQFALGDENKYKQLAAYEEPGIIASVSLPQFTITWDEIFAE